MVGEKTGLQQVDERSKKEGALPLFIENADYRKQLSLDAF
jgi:hypothetical protein